MSWDVEAVALNDETFFQTLNGLWTGKKPPFVTTGVIRNTNFTESGRIDYSDVACLEVEAKQLAKRQLKPGDIIVERSGGGPKQPVGRVVYFDRKDGPFSFSNFTSAIRVNDTATIDAKFAFYGLLELYQSGGTEDIQRRTTGIRNLDFTAYKERASFPKISLAEQRKIAGVLGLVQRAMEQQERLIALTTELKKTLLHQLFTQGLRGEPQKETEIGPVPQSWDVVKLGELFDTQLGKMLSQKARIGDDPKPYLRNKNVQWGAIDTTDLLSMDFNERERGKFILVPGDLLICEGGEPGRAAIWQGALKKCYYQKALHRLRPKSDTISNEFLAHWLEFALRYQDLYGVAGASSTIAHLPEVQIKMLPVPLPTKDEQDAIVESLNAVDNETALHQRKHTALTALFRTLLHQLMTAQFRVHELELPDVEASK